MKNIRSALYEQPIRIYSLIKVNNETSCCIIYLCVPQIPYNWTLYDLIHYHYSSCIRSITDLIYLILHALSDLGYPSGSRNDNQIWWNTSPYQLIQKPYASWMHSSVIQRNIHSLFKTAYRKIKINIYGQQNIRGILFTDVQLKTDCVSEDLFNECNQ